MPQPRLLLPDGGHYHAFSRIVDRRKIFGAIEKEYFVLQLRKLEAFLDVRVLTYCVMSNHFHLLVEVPQQVDIIRLTPDSLRARLPLLYHGKALEEARDEIDRAVANRDGPTGTSTWIDGIVARYQARMGDLSTFVRELKWRFTMWYNDHNDRVGTLWEDRFKSVLIEGDEHALMTIAAYIELNPIRGGLASDPKDYRWCGYAEAVAGMQLSRRNLALMHSRVRNWQGKGLAPVSWREVAATYRMHIFGQGQTRLGDGKTRCGARKGIAPKKVTSVVDDEAGEIPFTSRLLGRVRYFTEGAAIGSSRFVDSVFESQRERFGKKRKSGARKMRGANWGGLSTLRDLRQNLYD